MEWTDEERKVVASRILDQIMNGLTERSHTTGELIDLARRAQFALAMDASFLKLNEGNYREFLS